MKRTTLLILLLLLLVPAATNVIYAQDRPIIVVPPSEPEKDKDGDGIPDSDDKCPSKAGPRTNRGCPEDDGGSDDGNPSGDPSGGEDPDRDGDGLSDKDDQCPDAGGPTWNGGCPEDEPDRDDVPPSSPDPNDPPPFQPPALPDDACYVTPSINNNINVRKAANLGADIIGFLIPGVVYEAQGVATVGSEAWYALVTYEGSTGTVGYASGTVVLATLDCPPVDEPVTGTSPEPAADDFAIPDDDPEVLCFLSVGFDAPTWAENPDMASIHYASFYFESEPGEPLPAGTQAWGVISVEDFITLPDSSNIIAVAPNPQVYEQALNSGTPNIFNYPTLAGGIRSGDTTLYRLTDDVGDPGSTDGNCGPIVGEIDDFAVTPSTGGQSISIPIDQFACTVETSFDWIFAFNYAPGESIPTETSPIAILHTGYAGGADPNIWSTAVEEVNGIDYQYMDYPLWASLVRTGGTCGPIEGAAHR